MITELGKSNFFFLTEVHDDVNLTLTLCVALFRVDCFVNLSQCKPGFAKRLLLKNGAAATILDSTANPQSYVV